MNIAYVGKTHRQNYLRGRHHRCYWWWETLLYDVNMIHTLVLPPHWSKSTVRITAIDQELQIAVSNGTVWRRYARYLLIAWRLSVTINNTDRYRVSNPALNEQYDEINDQSSRSSASLYLWRPLTQRLSQAPSATFPTIVINGQKKIRGYPSWIILSVVTWTALLHLSDTCIHCIDTPCKYNWNTKDRNTFHKDNLKAYPAVLAELILSNRVIAMGRRSKWSWRRRRLNHIAYSDGEKVRQRSWHRHGMRNFWVGRWGDEWMK